MEIKRLPRKSKKIIKTKYMHCYTYSNAYLQMKYGKDYKYLISFITLKTILNYPNSSNIEQIIEWYKNNYTDHHKFINFVENRNPY